MRCATAPRATSRDVARLSSVSSGTMSRPGRRDVTSLRDFDEVAVGERGDGDLDDLLVAGQAGRDPQGRAGVALDRDRNEVDLALRVDDGDAHALRVAVQRGRRDLDDVMRDG